MTTSAPVRCRACADVEPEPRCSRCSAALVLADRCPCCNADAGASPDPELRFVCDVCGGPRIPRLDPSTHYAAAGAALLRNADDARKARALWRGVAIAAGLVLPVLIGASLGLLLLGPSLGAFAAAALITAPFVGLLVSAMSRARTRGREIPVALDGAWLAAASDIARQKGGATPATLSLALGIDDARAEELAAQLELEPLAPRLRIRAQGTLDAAPPDAEALAEADAEADAGVDKVERMDSVERARLRGGGKP